MKKYILLYHYSNKNISGKLSPEYFAKNYYTNNDNKISSVKRLFFYDTKKPEFLLSNCQYLYTAKIPCNCLYDLRMDKKRYIKRYNNITLILKAIKRDYKGIIYNVGNYNIITLFESIKYDKMEDIKHVTIS